MAENAIQAGIVTFDELLRWRAEHQPGQTAYTFLIDGEREQDSLTYAQVDQWARTIAAYLQNLSLSGERILLLYPPGLEFIAAFWGCLYAGAVAVPFYPPRRNRVDERLLAVAKDSQPTAILTLANMQASLSTRDPQIPGVRWLSTDRLDRELALAWKPPSVDGKRLAFLQYTSGSTGTPKGVMVSHANLLHNSEHIYGSLGHSSQTRGFNWLPFYHDMGLLGGVLQPIYGDFPVILMSPTAFIERPVRWLEAISRYQITTSGGPNFAYDLCVRRITPKQGEMLDLSSWITAFNGAEPVRAETLSRFIEAFEPYGFSRTAFYPCYGMAETTVMISGGVPAEVPLVLWLDAAALEQNEVRPAMPDNQGVRAVVSCGRTWPDAGQPAAVIVEPESGLPCHPDQVGEIWVSGASVAQGYWGRPEETAAVFKADLASRPPSQSGLGLKGLAGVEPGQGQMAYLRTGDLGFLQDGQLFVTGRLKELIIIRGRNHYPQDIEATVGQSHPALQRGSGAAFSVDVDGEEQLVVIQEIKRTQRRNLNVEQVIEAACRAVSEQHELQLYALYLIKPMRLSRTSSGKIRRQACRSRFLANDFDNDLIAGHVLTSFSDGARAIPVHDQPMFDQLMQLEADARQKALEALLQQQLAQSLRLRPEQIPASSPLSALGIDSLLMFDLKYQIESNFNLTLPAQAFQQATLSGLAEQVAVQLAAAVSPSPIDSTGPGQGMLTGPAPLTPIQHYFFEHVTLDPHHWNGTALLEFARPLQADLLEGALRALIIHHDALRLRFLPGKRGWQQLYTASTDDVPFITVDLSSLTRAQQDRAIAEKSAELQGRINISTGPLVFIALFDCGLQRANQLLLIMHHLIFDGISALTLLRDLQSAYQQLDQGMAIQLPAKTTSYRAWAERLQEYVWTNPLSAAQDYWLPATSITPLPLDDPDGDNTEGSESAIIKALDPDLSQVFLQRLQGQPPLMAEALLLTAWSQAYTNWSGERSLLIELERHGREIIFPDVDLSRTVGFFNNRFPFHYAWAGREDLSVRLKAILAQLNELPGRGLDYGLLRYLKAEETLASRLRDLPQPEIKFTYHAQVVNQALMTLSQGWGAEGLDIISTGMSINSATGRTHALFIYAYFLGPQLHLDLRYSQNLHQTSTIERIAADYVETLRSLCLGLQAEGQL